MIDEGLIEYHYPTDEAIARIRDFRGTPFEMADFVGELLEGMGYGSYRKTDILEQGFVGNNTANPYEERYHQRAFVTGGWSGCEEVLSHLEKTLFHFAFWESSHRGGRVVYRIPEGEDRDQFWGELW